VEISERAPDIADFVVNVQNIMLGGQSFLIER